MAILGSRQLIPAVALLIGLVTIFAILYQARIFFSPVISALVMGIVVSPFSRLRHRPLPETAPCVTPWFSGCKSNMTKSLPWVRYKVPKPPKQ